MNTKLKGVLQLLVILLVTAAVCVVAYTGIGGAKRGSAKNIRLGLDFQVVSALHTKRQKKIQLLRK